MRLSMRVKSVQKILMKESFTSYDTIQDNCYVHV